jgi:hypothetical protein
MISGKCRLCLIANSPLPVWAQCAAMALRSLKLRAVPVYGECVGQAKQRVVSHMLSRLFSTQRALFARAPLSLLHFERAASGRCACYQP